MNELAKQYRSLFNAYKLTYVSLYDLARNIEGSGRQRHIEGINGQIDAYAEIISSMHTDIEFPEHTERCIEVNLENFQKCFNRLSMGTIRNVQCRHVYEMVMFQLQALDGIDTKK